MITQAAIEAAYFRAIYGDLVDPGLPVCWYGAGVMARRLAAALPTDVLARVEAIFDDNPSPALGSITVIPVRMPDPDDPPAQVVLATDTHAEVFRSRCAAIWRERPAVVDLFSPPIGAWTDPGDGPGGFARTHPERWREALGVAQLELESLGDQVLPLGLWMLAHARLCTATNRVHFGFNDEDRYLEQRETMQAGQVFTVLGDRPLRSDPFWGSVIEAHHAAISPDGMGAAITRATHSQFPVCPALIGNALWIPQEPSNIVRALYDSAGPGAKKYTVQFTSGIEIAVTATRERTYADVRGLSELTRYELFIKELPRGARVLDCATGTGPGADLLASMGYEVVGVDIDPGAVEFARARYPGAEFLCATVMDLPFPDGHFDAVVSIETIEHLPDPVGAIAELVRVCKPSGLLCLTTPGEGACDSPYHEVELTAEDLRMAMDHAFGDDGWTGESVPGPGAWHTMIIRRAQAAHL